MKWYSAFNHPEGLYFIIEQDAKVGFYVYVYDNEDGFKEDRFSSEYCKNPQEDHLQFTLQMAQEFAEEDFGVPLDSWVEISKAE